MFQIFVFKTLHRSYSAHPNFPDDELVREADGTY